jgi:hypothetical protein
MASMMADVEDDFCGGTDGCSAMINRAIAERIAKKRDEEILLQDMMHSTSIWTLDLAKSIMVGYVG